MVNQISEKESVLKSIATTEDSDLVGKGLEIERNPMNSTDGKEGRKQIAFLAVLTVEKG